MILGRPSTPLPVIPTTTSTTPAFHAIEIVLGGDKGTRDLGRVPSVATTGGNMTFTFMHDRNSINSSVSVIIEVGTNLST